VCEAGYVDDDVGQKKEKQKKKSKPVVLFLFFSSLWREGIFDPDEPEGK